MIFLFVVAGVIVAFLVFCIAVPSLWGWKDIF